MAVIAGALSALFVGFVTGYLCGRKCRKDEDDNLPYPDTEYEYFEQRQNVNRYVSMWKIIVKPMAVERYKIFKVLHCLY